MGQFPAPLPKDYNLEVLRGNITGHSMVTISCEIETLTTTRITISPNLTTELITQSALHTTSATVDVASDSADDDSAGTGLRTLTLIGLNDSGAAQTETITMDGQTEVTSASNYSAIHGFRGLTYGSGNTSAGNIYVGNGTFTSGVPATMIGTGEAGHNRSAFGYYTVPTGKKLYLRQFTMSMVGSNKEAKVHVETSANGIQWITENEFGLESGGNFQGNIIAVPAIAGDTNIRITGLAGASSTELAVILGCELVDD